MSHEPRPEGPGFSRKHGETSKPPVSETTVCSHDFRDPVVCPQCDPATYERAGLQVRKVMERATMTADHNTTVYRAFDGRLTYRSRDPFIDGQPVGDITPPSMRGDHPPGVTPIHHKWLPYRSGGPGWRICQWCGLTQRPEEIAHAE